MSTKRCIAIHIVIDEDAWQEGVDDRKYTKDGLTPKARIELLQLVNSWSAHDHISVEVLTGTFEFIDET